MRFEDIMDGKVQNPTTEQVEEALKETVSSFTTLKDMNEFLQKLHESDAYKVIRDMIQPKTNLIVKRAKEEDIEQYQLFQDIQKQSKAVFDWERTQTTNGDAQNIATQIASQVAQRFYGICLRMINTLDDELGKVEVAINRIEEHIGLEKTDFSSKEDNHDTTKSGNEQRGKEVIE